MPCTDYVRQLNPCLPDLRPRSRAGLFGSLPTTATDLRTCLAASKDGNAKTYHCLGSVQ